MEFKDIPKGKWFRLGHSPAAYEYERWMFATNLKMGSTHFYLDIGRNVNNPELEGSNSFLQDGFWKHHNSNEIYVMDPPELNRLEKECIISIFEGLDQ